MRCRIAIVKLFGNFEPQVARECTCQQRPHRELKPNPVELMGLSLLKNATSRGDRIAADKSVKFIILIDNKHSKRKRGSSRDGENDERGLDLL